MSNKASHPADPASVRASEASRPLAPVNRNGLAIFTCFVLAAVLFDQVAVSIAIGLIAFLFYQCLYLRNARVIAALISATLSLSAFQWVGGRIIRSTIARTHAVDIDHRMRPNLSYLGTNEDGVRCDVNSDAYAERDFNIIFSGDSFVYGFGIEDSASVAPYVLERLCNARGMRPRVHCVDFGWTSSSPLLSLRLLKDVGAKYKPDLVVYMLDMTDFHDDLRYEHGKGAVGLSPTQYLAYRLNLADAYLSVHQRFRAGRLLEALTLADAVIPGDRFFVTNRPLGASAPYMQATERNLRAMADVCRETLGCEFAVIMFPRAFQFAPREAPKNWEAALYDPDGPHNLEPFKWLRRLDGETDFPCRSILGDFRSSGEFPLFFEDDPHWNEAGHRVAAQAVMDALVEEGLLP